MMLSSPEAGCYP